MTASPTLPSIGIIGNVGPTATTRLYNFMIRLYQVRLGAVRNADFPRFHVHSPRPIENVRTNGDASDIYLESLLESVALLNAAGSDLITVPCNTLHRLLPSLQRVSQAPIVDMIAATAEVCLAADETQLFLLATRGTIASGLYQDAIADSRVSLQVPSEHGQQIIDGTIDEICAGLVNRDLSSLLRDVGAPSGAGIILGCTELSELASSADLESRTSPERRLYDSLRVLAETTFTMALEL